MFVTDSHTEREKECLRVWQLCFIYFNKQLMRLLIFSLV